MFVSRQYLEYPRGTEQIRSRKKEKVSYGDCSNRARASDISVMETYFTLPQHLGPKTCTAREDAAFLRHSELGKVGVKYKDFLSQTERAATTVTNKMSPNSRQVRVMYTYDISKTFSIANNRFRNVCFDIYISNKKKKFLVEARELENNTPFSLDL